MVSEFVANVIAKNISVLQVLGRGLEYGITRAIDVKLIDPLKNKHKINSHLPEDLKSF